MSDRTETYDCRIYSREVLLYNPGGMYVGSVIFSGPGCPPDFHGDTDYALSVTEWCANIHDAQFFSLEKMYRTNSKAEWDVLSEQREDHDSQRKAA